MIRTTVRSDIPAVRALMQAIPGFWSADWQEDVLERAIGPENTVSFVWVQQDQIQGFVCAHDLGFRAYLSELAVAEPARGQGIGQKLVRQVEQALSARGCSILISDVWRDAEGFYRSLGWQAPPVTLLRHKLP